MQQYFRHSRQLGARPDIGKSIMRKISVIILLLLTAIHMYGCPMDGDTIVQGEVVSIDGDSVMRPMYITDDSVQTHTKRPLYKKVIDGVVSVLKEFNNVYRAAAL